MSEFQVNVFLVNQDGNTDNPSHKVRSMFESESVHKLFIVSQCLMLKHKWCRQYSRFSNSLTEIMKVVIK